ncbi:MAG TPA: DUF4388 domain-containing protein [Candidatus Polarisedimenticolaceae bacterium]|nr:DUF4388 domain-containing protein [Candidatus Polarisedimenticolaceae bacterium]
MPVQGNLATMSLAEILQWLGNARKTGTLAIERNKVEKRILVQEGRVVACASQEPADMLGHYLVSRGRISEIDLRTALAAQEKTKTHLGRILVAQGALAEDELLRCLEDKAQEAIFGLFEWSDAEFRFTDGEASGDDYGVNMRVEDILLRGAQRWDELQRIRAVFNDPGIVLRRTSRVPPPEVLRNRMARRIVESVNGDRTVAEILLHAHGSEYIVTKFLHELFRAGVFEISEVRKVEERPTAETEGNVFARERAIAAATAAVAAPPVPSVKVDADDLEVARRLLTRGEYDAALDILDRAYKIQSGDDALRRLLAEAEAAFIEKAYRHFLPPNKIVVLARDVGTLTAEHLSPAEFFLLSRIDGSWDVKSIIQITPLREVDVLRTLKKMREKGIIDLKDPPPAAF